MSPTLFNIYTSDIPPPPPNVTLTTYADDMNPASSHKNYQIAKQNIQPYLQDIFAWTKSNDLILNPDKSNDLILNPDKSTSTLFTPDPAEYNTELNLTINNTIIPTVKNPRPHLLPKNYIQ